VSFLVRAIVQLAVLYGVAVAIAVAITFTAAVLN
jgi:hypothetical protein